MAPMALAVPVVIVSAFVLLGMSESKKIKGDSAIAVLSSSALAVGVVANSLAGGSAADLGGYLFGSILALKKSDVILSVVLSLVVICLFVLFKNRIFAVTFDMPFAKSAGVHVKFYNMLLALLIALTVVVGMQIVGTMLISSLIIFPALSAMQIAESFKGVIVFSAIISVFTFAVGLLVNFILSNVFVFKEKEQREKGRTVSAFLIYALVGVIGFVLTELLTICGTLIIGEGGIWYLLLTCFVKGAVLIWNYVGRKIFVYRGK